MKTFWIIALIFFCPIINLFGQLEIDYYGEYLVYKGDVISVTSLYYAPVYNSDTIIDYKIEPYGVVPHASVAYFNKKGKLVKFEEYESQCGLLPECLKYRTQYSYQDTLLIQKKKYTKDKPQPKVINFSYQNEGDSIYYKVEKRPNYVSFKTAKTKKSIIKERNSASGQVYKTKMALNAKGLPINYERFVKNELRIREEYTYPEDDISSYYQVDFLNLKSNSTYQKYINFNKEGFVSSSETYNAEGRLTFSTTFEHQYDDQGNWIEMKIFNIKNREMYKVVKTYEYR